MYLVITFVVGVDEITSLHMIFAGAEDFFFSTSHRAAFCALSSSQRSSFGSLEVEHIRCFVRDLRSFFVALRAGPSVRTRHSLLT